MPPKTSTRPGPFAPPMEFVDPAVARYAEEHSTALPARLHGVEKDTRERTPLPAMLSGDVVAGLLGILVAATGARRVIEVGTFTGFSALAMAARLPDEGEVVTLEADADFAAMAQEHCDRDPHGSKVKIVVGDAHEQLPRMKGPFDLAFLDADKEGYPDHWENLVPLVRPGGLLVVDNTLWSGKVLEPEKDDAATRAIHALNRRIRDDGRVSAVMLTVRDGVTLALRNPPGDDHESGDTLPQGDPF